MSLRGALVAFAGLVVLGSSSGCAFSAPRYRGPVSDHFDGERFHNLDPEKEHGFRDFLRWVRNRRPGPWRDYQDAPPGPPPPRRVEGGAMRVTFVNHSTLLLQTDGLNILTDPIWSDRASPVSFLGPHRVRPPGLRFEDLPPIHVVLLSHNHYDHLDLATLRRLQAAHRPRFVVGLGNRALLERAGIRGAVELDWWQEAPLAPGVQVVAVPARHFSNRGLFDRYATLWAGYVVRGPAGRAYFAGDTGSGVHFEQIARRFGPLRLAALPIGAFQPRWFMAPYHTGPDDAVRAQAVLGAGTAVAIHFGTFRLADDGQDAPERGLEQALAAADPRPRFWVLVPGEGRDVPPLEAESAAFVPAAAR